MSMKKYNCGCYYRSAYKEKDNIKDSSIIKKQKEEIIKYCQKNNLKIIKEYIDEGYSGLNYERASYNEMISDIKKGIINCVIVSDFSRITRNINDDFNRILKHYNIRFIITDINYDSILNSSNKSKHPKDIDIYR